MSNKLSSEGIEKEDDDNKQDDDISIDTVIPINDEIDPIDAARDIFHHEIDSEFKTQNAKNLVKGKHI